MRELINQSLSAIRGELQQKFSSAQPFQYIVIDDFLEPDFARLLLDSFPAFDEKLAINGNGEVGAKAVHEKIARLGPAWWTLNKLVTGSDFRSLISDLAGIADLQFAPHYFGGGTHENLHGQS